MKSENSDLRKPIHISTNPISPNSKKVHIAGSIHPQIRVPFREITLTTSQNGNGNGTQALPDSAIVYDTSGSYTDPNKTIDVRKGMEPIRAEWIRSRDNVEAYEGRTVKPGDNGYKNEERLGEKERFSLDNRKILRAKHGNVIHAVTCSSCQLL